MKRLIILCFVLLLLSCDRDDSFNATLTEGPAPVELQANIVFNNDMPPFSVTFNPTATNATAFEVFSGLPNDAGNLIGIQTPITFSYPESDTNFFATIVAIAANGKVTEQQFEIIPPADPCASIFSAPVNWDSDGPSAFEFGFNGAVLSVVPNPDLSGDNPNASNVLQIVQDGGGNFDGFGVQMLNSADFSGDDKIVRLLFWSNTQVNVRLAMRQEPNNQTAREVEVNLTHTGSGWEELRFDFANASAGFTGNADGALGIPDFSPHVPTGEYIRFQMFIGPGEDVSGTFYLDNVGVCP